MEEALCFGWIDGMLDHYDETTYLRRFTPRRRNSPYSRLNIERLIWLDSQGMIHPKIREQVKSIIESEYIFPEDILDEIRRDPVAWSNYQSFPAPYRRVRIAHIDAARGRSDEFRRRLETFIAKTRANKLIDTYGCFDRYRRSASGEYDITCAVDTVRMKETLADIGLESSRLSEILGYPESDVQRYLDLYEGGEPDSIPMGMRSLLDFVVNGSDIDREKVDLYILSNFSDQYERCGA